MNDIIKSLQTQVDETGIIILDRTQAEILIRWLNTVEIAFKQQDALVLKLKSLVRDIPSGEAGPESPV